MSGPGKSLRYAEVWGDTVDLKHLAASAVIGVVLTMGGYILGLRFFSAQASLSKALVNGYSLMVGVTGCVVSGVVCASLYKPKRVLVEEAQSTDLAETLAAIGMTPEEEAAALETIEPAAKKELQELGLLDTLARPRAKGGA